MRSRLERGEVSAVAAVRASLENIARRERGAAHIHQPARKRGAARGAEGGLKRKAHADAERPAGALWGVPLAIKDLIDVRGMRTTAASRVLEDEAPATDDAECVRRLRAAGRSSWAKQICTSLPMAAAERSVLTARRGIHWTGRGCAEGRLPVRRRRWRRECVLARWERIRRVRSACLRPAAEWSALSRPGARFRWRG